MGMEAPIGKEKVVAAQHSVATATYYGQQSEAQWCRSNTGTFMMEHGV